MKTLTLNKTGSDQWDFLADAVNGEAGEVTGFYVTEGNTFYTALFPKFRGELAAIPAAVCTVTEVPDPAA